MNKKYIEIVKHYESCLKIHGDNHMGVDWPNLNDTEIRYKVMLELIPIKERNRSSIEVLDFGCGTSLLYQYILNNAYENIHYCGLDISKEFINICKSKYPSNTYYCMDILESKLYIKNFDYIIMNGVFTEKRTLTFEEMLEYFKSMIKKVMQICNKGLAFNVMSKNVDWERDDLFHLPLDILTQFLTKDITRNFIIRSDYGLYEYTVYLYK